MKYFFIETDDKNRIPYHINKNKSIDPRLLTKRDFAKLPLWNIVEMDFYNDGFYPDIICKPFILLSATCLETALLYQPDLLYKGIKLWNKSSGANATYFLVFLDELECMSDKTEYNIAGNKVTNLVLDRKKIGSQVIFKVKGFDKSGIIGRLDFLESIVRRDVRGIQITEIAIFP